MKRTNPCDDFSNKLQQNLKNKHSHVDEKLDIIRNRLELENLSFDIFVQSAKDLSYSIINCDKKVLNENVILNKKFRNCVDLLFKRANELFGNPNIDTLFNRWIKNHFSSKEKLKTISYIICNINSICKFSNNLFYASNIEYLLKQINKFITITNQSSVNKELIKYITNMINNLANLARSHKLSGIIHIDVINEFLIKFSELTKLGYVDENVKSISIIFSTLGNLGELKLLKGMIHDETIQFFSDIYNVSLSEIHCQEGRNDDQFTSEQDPINYDLAYSTQHISMVIFGLGRMAKSGQLNITLDVTNIIQTLLEEFNSFTARFQYVDLSRHIATIISGLGQLVESDQLDVTFNVTQSINSLLGEFSTTYRVNFEREKIIFQISLLIAGLGRIAEARQLNLTLKSTNIIRSLVKDFIVLLSENDYGVTARIDILMFTYGLSRIAEVGQLDPTWDLTDTIQSLLQHFIASCKIDSKKEDIIRDIGRFIFSLGKIAESGFLTGTTNDKTIQSLAEHFMILSQACLKPGEMFLMPIPLKENRHPLKLDEKYRYLCTVADIDRFLSGLDGLAERGCLDSTFNNNKLIQLHLKQLITQYITCITDTTSQLCNPSVVLGRASKILKVIALFVPSDQQLDQLQHVSKIIIDFTWLSTPMAAKIVHALVNFKDKRKIPIINFVFNYAMETLEKVGIDYLLPKFLQSLRADLILLSGTSWGNALQKVLNPIDKKISSMAHNKPIMHAIPLDLKRVPENNISLVSEKCLLPQEIYEILLVRVIRRHKKTVSITYDDKNHSIVNSVRSIKNKKINEPLTALIIDIDKINDYWIGCSLEIENNEIQKIIYYDSKENDKEVLASVLVLKESLVKAGLIPNTLDVTIFSGLKTNDPTHSQSLLIENFYWSLIAPNKLINQTIPTIDQIRALQLSELNKYDPHTLKRRKPLTENDENAQNPIINKLAANDVSIIATKHSLFAIQDSMITAENITPLSQKSPDALTDSGIPVAVTVNSVEHKKYNVKDMASIEQLNKLHAGQFSYNLKAQELPKNIDLSVAPVFVIGGQYGVYAEIDIPINRTPKKLGYYIGRRLVGVEAEKILKKQNTENQNGFLMEIPLEDPDKDGNDIIIIDGEKERIFTAFINHSETPNCRIEYVYDKKNKQYEVAFYPIREIKKGEQLTINYGAHYFEDSFYLHKSDNWESYAECYQRNKNNYQKNLYSANDKLLIDLNLPEKSKLLLPSIFLDIENNDVNAIKEKIKQKYPLDMLAYSAGESGILDPDSQQHFTALMYACYRQKLECITALIDSNRVDVNRLMLRSGCSALMLLLLNPPESTKEKYQIENLAIKIFEKMEQPFALNAQGFNILHYAIKGNFNRLLKSILERADKSKIYMPYDIMTPLVTNKKSNENCDFDFCIANNRLDTLKILFSYVFPDKTAQLQNGNICSYIADGTCFRPETLELLSDDQLKSLQDLLEPYQVKVSNHTHLLQDINKKLNKMTAEVQLSMKI